MLVVLATSCLAWQAWPDVVCPGQTSHQASISERERERDIDIDIDIDRDRERESTRGETDTL